MAARKTVLLTDRIHDQCAFETRLAKRLRNADRGERIRLYGQVYDEYAEKFPEFLPKDSTNSQLHARHEVSFLLKFLTPDMVVAEIGPGRCHLAFALAPLVTKLYGVDVSQMEGSGTPPSNFELRLTNGINMPFESNSIDLVISIQLMEHLHPDDADDQLREVYRVLRTGGRYICITPTRINGPHDCSAYFDDLPCPIANGHYIATGLHLKEYTTRELLTSLRKAGFTRQQTFIGARGKYIALPPFVMTSIELALRLIPPSRRKRSRLLGLMLGNRVCATKR